MNWNYHNHRMDTRRFHDRVPDVRDGSDILRWQYHGARQHYPSFQSAQMCSWE
jgi:hypothetical protein